MDHSMVMFAQTEMATGTLFEGFSTDQRFVLVIVGMSSAVVLTIVLGGVVAGVWSSIREKQIQADLKRDMLDRGMTAEEIQQVIEATPRSGFDRWMGSWCKKS